MKGVNYLLKGETKPSDDFDFGSQPSTGLVPPHSLDAEQSVLGAIFIDNESVNAVLEIIQAEDFYQKGHKILFETMHALYERGEPIDIVMLAEELKNQQTDKGSNLLQQVGGVEYLSHLVDIVPTAANTQFYARVIKGLSVRRQVIHVAAEITDLAFHNSGNLDQFVDTVEQKVFGISENRINPGFVSIGDLVKDSIKMVEERFALKEAITGVPTGFKDLDELTSGLQPSDLIILAGRPAMGKTSLALSIARNIAFDAGGRVAVFSLEMSKEQIVTRLLCSEARVGNSRVRSGKLGESDFPRLVDAASRMAQADIMIDETPALPVMEMRAKARRLHREKPLSVIVIDYLQLMRSSLRRTEHREQEISDISARLKGLAKELSVPVIALSQLNRAVESRTDKRPIMADLRESGAIEQDADIIGFVYRDEVYNPDTADKGVAELIISKHRNGSVGTVRMAFQGEYTRFEDLAEVEDYDYLGAEFNSDEDEDFI